MQTVIAHIDMNSYFASCEQQDNPAWRGKPLGVCEHLGGIIIAPSIEAKRWGIKTAMPVWEAKKRYPKIILTQTNPDRYRFYTRRFLKVFGDYTDKIEKYSIDEAFLDLTMACNVRGYQNGQLQKLNPWQEAERIAKEIKTRMKVEVGDWLKCSIGIAPSKLLAKIASDLRKPDGLTVVRPEDKPSLYDRLKLTDAPGIGYRQERNLNKLGIFTLKDLRDYPLTKLVTHFGIAGFHLHSIGQLQGSWKEGFGEDVVSEPLKSMGHMYTIPTEYRRKKVLKPVLYKLSEMVGARLRVNGFMGNHIHAHVYDGNELHIGRGAKLGYFVQDGREIYLEAMALLRSAGDISALDANTYFVGVTVSGLAPFTPQNSLFGDVAKQRRLAEALDKINEKYEDFTVARVPAFLAREIIRDSVGFGRMKEFKTTWMRGGQGRFK